MKNNNIFITGGEVSGEHMIGYRDKIQALSRMINQKMNATGGIYVYGMYRMGKTSVAKQCVFELLEHHTNLICAYLNLNQYNTNAPQRFADFLEGIIIEIQEQLEDRIDMDLTKVQNKIDVFFQQDKATTAYRLLFNKIFTQIKKTGLIVLLVIDEFDAAKDVFSCKADFELFRELTASPSYSVCLVTISRQELSLIEHENPNNSSFKGVMYPFPIKGFTDDDIQKYRDVTKEYYNFELNDDDIELLNANCGASPYLWACIGYEMAESVLLQQPQTIEEILNSTAIISKIGGYHDSIFSCLEHDIDRKQVSYADKLASVIIGPSFLATEEDVKLLISMHYLIDTGTKYLAFSSAFQKYLMSMTYNNDVLNNFSTLEKKMKSILEMHKQQLFAQANATNGNEDENWYTLLSKAWQNMKSSFFDSSLYKKQIQSTKRKFHVVETALNVMSLDDVLLVARDNWTVIMQHFNNEPLPQWSAILSECGKARNPIHHGSDKRVYTIEDQTRINAFCLKIIKQIS